MILEWDLITIRKDRSLSPYSHAFQTWYIAKHVPSSWAPWGRTDPHTTSVQKESLEDLLQRRHFLLRGWMSYNCAQKKVPQKMTLQQKTTDQQKGKDSASVVLYKGKYQNLSSIYSKYEIQWITARQVFSRRDGPMPNTLFLNTQHYIAAPIVQAPLQTSAVSFPWTITAHNWVLLSSFLIWITFMFVYQISVPV